MGTGGGRRGHLPVSLVCPPAGRSSRSTTTTCPPEASPTQDLDFGPLRELAGGRRHPIQKFPRWDRKFGHEHFLTKTSPIRARRVCKKGPLKARGRLGTEGRPLLLAKVVLFGGCQIFSDKHPVPAGGVSLFLVDQLVFSWGGRPRPSGLLRRGAPWPLAAAPLVGLSLCC